MGSQKSLSICDSQDYQVYLTNQVTCSTRFIDNCIEILKPLQYCPLSIRPSVIVENVIGKIDQSYFDSFFGDLMMVLPKDICLAKLHKYAVRAKVYFYQLSEFGTSEKDRPAEELIGEHGDYVQMFSDLFGELDAYNVTKEIYPTNAADYDLFIITGSRYSCYEDIPWITKLKEFVRLYDKTPIKFFGVCFGHQIIAEALGGKVLPNDKGWEIGWISVRLNEGGQKILSKDTIAIQSMHKDHVVQLPPGFTALGSTELSPIQCMYKPHKYFTIQGHPEFSAAYTKALINMRLKAGIFTPQLVASLPDINQDLDMSFNAHSMKTTCAKIGPKSGRVMATGGQDRNVNLWAIGKQKSILSLTGHVTQVDSVALDWPEELVVAGSAGGSLKLWDLEQAKVIRTLSGHRSNIKSVEFHPFGEFFASGSSDLSIKIWDVRRKGCIQTYHGHDLGINSLKITPDGRWIASGSEDGTVKIWDMTAGKLLHTISDADGPIHSLSFNPTEFIIASCSMDGYLRVYDLQNFELISSYKESYSEQIIFTPDGQNLLAGAQDALQILTWEPITLVNEVPVKWSNVKDIKVLPDSDKAIACTINGSFIDVWGFKISENTSTSQTNEEYFDQTTPEPVSQQIEKITDETKKLGLESHPISDIPPNLPKVSKKFKYIPSPDGSKPLNLDLQSFIKQKCKQEFENAYMILTELSAGGDLGNLIKDTLNELQIIYEA
ncbi:hypothetical protein HDV06_005816 [Boothiomyces sp. JEL0866]|nr:hypothetical protein HDV06_005816 [Boothiomyces sp. JEL0866]